MTKIKFFLHSYDRLDDRAIDNLTSKELECVKCYTVEKSVIKNITPKVERINEWELEWNDYSYRDKKYYDYGAIVHLIQNPHLLEGLTHVGLMQYDVLFQKNSVNNIISKLDENPNIIFYNNIRSVQDLWLTEFEFIQICNFVSEKMKINIDVMNIVKNGWISETFSVTPIEVFRKFGEFILNNKQDIEDILDKNRWGIMNNIKHRMCGIVERMWGFYLVSLNCKLEKMDIEHDHNAYYHQHEEEK